MTGTCLTVTTKESIKESLRIAAAVTLLIEAMTLVGALTTIDGVNVWQKPAIFAKDMLIEITGTPAAFLTVLAAVAFAKMASIQYGKENAMGFTIASVLTLLTGFASLFAAPIQGKVALNYFSPGLTDGTPDAGMLAADCGVGAFLTSATFGLLCLGRLCLQQPATEITTPLTAMGDTTQLAMKDSCLDAVLYGTGLKVRPVLNSTLPV